METEQVNSTPLAKELRTLEEYRNNLAILKEEFADIKKSFEDQNRNLITAIEDIKGEIDMAQAAIRRLALQMFAETGEKKLPGGVGIRMKKSMTYADSTAMEWSAENCPAAIKKVLDTKVFEKLVTSLETPPTFVEIKEEPQATIPKVIVFGDC